MGIGDLLGRAPARIAHVLIARPLCALARGVFGTELALGKSRSHLAKRSGVLITSPVIPVNDGYVVSGCRRLGALRAIAASIYYAAKYDRNDKSREWTRVRSGRNSNV